MKQALLPLLTLALAASIPAVPSTAKPALGPVSPAAKCAVFWSAMSRIAPEGSEANTQMNQRKDAWMAQAAKEVGEAEAKRVLNANGPAEGARVRALASDPDALQKYAAGFPECEEVSVAKPAVAKAAPVMTERDIAASKRAFGCAGMAQVYTERGNFIATSLWGTPEFTREVIDYLHPAMSDAEKQAKIDAGASDFEAMLARDEAKEKAMRAAGKFYNEEKHSEMRPFNTDCAKLVNSFHNNIKNSAFE